MIPSNTTGKSDHVTWARSGWFAVELSPTSISRSRLNSRVVPACGGYDRGGSERRGALVSAATVPCPLAGLAGLASGCLVDGEYRIPGLGRPTSGESGHQTDHEHNGQSQEEHTLPYYGA